MKKNSIRIVLAAVAIVFIVGGCINREFHDVFMKAVYIWVRLLWLGYL